MTTKHLVKQAAKASEVKNKALIVMLPESQHEEFRAFCRMNRITGAALVRSMIDQVVNSYEPIR